MTSKKRIHEEAQELASRIIDVIEDHLDQKQYSINEEHNVLINAILMLVTYPLEDIPAESRQEMIDQFLSIAREHMNSFNAFLRKENHEEN